MNLKSLHDVSYLNCMSAEILIGEGFNKCTIFDVKSGEEYETHPGAEDRPQLNILAEQGFTVKVMSDWEILRKQIMNKV